MASVLTARDVRVERPGAAKIDAVTPTSVQRVWGPPPISQSSEFEIMKPECKTGDLTPKSFRCANEVSATWQRGGQPAQQVHDTRSCAHCF